jgi:aminopeptidase-like protein
MKGGLFLEMMGRGYPPTFQRSLAGDTEVDLCFEQGILSVAPEARIIPFMPMNDERQFNSPGISVPMGVLYRILPKEHPDWPYSEYHSSQDDISHVDPESLEESCMQVLAMIDTIENNEVPVPLYRAEIFLSRYGLHVDWHQDPLASQQLYAILYQIDGLRSIAEIAAQLKVSFRTVRAVADRLVKQGLCRLVRSDAVGTR